MANDSKKKINEILRKHDINVMPITIMSYKEGRDAAVGHGSGIK